MWDYVSRLVLNASDVDQCEASDQRRDEDRAWIAWTESPPDHKSDTCSNWDLSEMIATVDLKEL